jgi:hypothetical protein
MTHNIKRLFARDARPAARRICAGDTAAVFRAFLRVLERLAPRPLRGGAHQKF